MNMKNLVRTYKTKLLDGKFEEDASGHCVTVEYTNDGIAERIVHEHSVLAHSAQMYAMSVIIQRKNNSGIWVDLEKVVMKTSPNNYFDTHGNKVTEPFEMVDTNEEKLNADGQSFEPKQYVQKKQLKAGLIKETDLLSASIGEQALYPYFTRAIKNNHEII